ERSRLRQDGVHEPVDRVAVAVDARLLLAPARDRLADERHQYTSRRYRPVVPAETPTDVNPPSHRKGRSVSLSTFVSHGAPDVVPTPNRTVCENGPVVFVV